MDSLADNFTNLMPKHFWLVMNVMIVFYSLLYFLLCCSVLTALEVGFILSYLNLKNKFIFVFHLILLHHRW